MQVSFGTSPNPISASEPARLSPEAPSPWPWFTTNEQHLYCQTLWHYAQGRRFILELGSGIEGMSAKVFKGIVQKTQGHVWSVDITDYGYRSDEWITFIVGDSLMTPWDRYIDLLYVDSSHEPQQTLQELEKFAPWVWRGGLILMDDLRHNGKPRLESVVDQFCTLQGLLWEYCAPEPNKIGSIMVSRRIC